MTTAQRRRESSVSSGSTSDRRFVDPIIEYLSGHTSNEPSSYGRPVEFSAPPPWYLFQYFCCGTCGDASGELGDSTQRSRDRRPAREVSLLDRRASLSGGDVATDPGLVSARMRLAARTTMLVTAFFVAIAQWAALASGVRYFEDLVGLSKGNASAASSAAFAVCFLSSIAGGVLGDARWGNIKSLFVGLVGALVSSTLLAIISFPSLGLNETTGGEALMAIGLFIFALSVGLCQTAIPNLVGDQCHYDPQRLQRYYNVYYGVIQGGAFLSRVLFPILHRRMDWFIAIGLCMTLPIALALLVFTMNSAVLAHRMPTDQVHAWQAFLIVSRSFFCCAPTDELEVHYGEEDVADAKKASKVLLLHLPLPIFWGLYFQMFELWYLQAEQLDLSIAPGTTIAAEQATALNPVFDVVLLLGFTSAFAALKLRWDINVRNTSKILFGYIAATGAFAYGIWLQVTVAHRDKGAISVWAQTPQYVLLCAAEVLVYPAALHEVYLNSPPAIRSFVQSCLWFFIGVGNAINVVVLATDSNLNGAAAKDSEDLTPLFIGYAVAMLAATILYTFIMIRYNAWSDGRGSRPQSTVEVQTQNGTEGGSSCAAFSASNMQQSEAQSLLHQKRITIPPHGAQGSDVHNLGAKRVPTPERRIPISPRTSGGTAVYHSTRKSPRTSALTSGEFNK